MHALGGAMELSRYDGYSTAYPEQFYRFINRAKFTRKPATETAPERCTYMINPRSTTTSK